MEETSKKNQTKFLISDFNARLRDLDERNRLTRERVLLLGKNLLSYKQEEEREIKKIKKENEEIKEELEKIKRTTNSILREIEKFVKKDDLIILERMLKDFQPLEFTREKDVKELIKQELSSFKKQIKTGKTKK